MSGGKPSPDVRSVRASDGARIEYEVTGDGPPLVLLHGILTGRRGFSRQRAALGAQFRLLLVSARGHDGSDMVLPPDYGAGATDVEDLRAVLDAEGIRRASVLAHSSGGATAFVFACRAPACVERMVLIEPTLFGLVLAADRPRFAADVARILDAADRGDPIAALLATLSATGGAAWSALSEADRRVLLHSLLPRAPLLGPHFRGLLALPAGEADLLGLAPPTLFVYGDATMTFEPLIAARVRGLRPDLPLRVIAGAGHAVHRDRAAAFNALALSFLRG